MPGKASCSNRKLRGRKDITFTLFWFPSQKTKKARHWACLSPFEKQTRNHPWHYYLAGTSMLHPAPIVPRQGAHIRRRMHRHKPNTVTVYVTVATFLFHSEAALG